jgi:hypothetical protein
MQALCCGAALYGMYRDTLGFANFGIGTLDQAA